jgi:general secretion pathway protein C
VLALTRAVHGLVRRTWLLTLVTVAICSAFAAHAVAALLQARYLDDVPSVTPVPVAMPAPAPAPIPDDSALVDRNLFCSDCAPAVTASAPAGAFIPDAVLIATSIGSLSIATLHVPATEVQGDFAVGDIVPGLGEIARIGFTTVDIRDREGRVGTLSLLSLNPGGRGELGAATPDPAAAAPLPFADRVHKIDDTTYEVDRALVRDLISATPATAGVRITPTTGKDGKLAGLRLFGVRAGSLAGSVGIQNGDTLVGINNMKIESANTLLDFYSQLDRLDHVELEGTRRGKPLTLTLRLR